MALLYGHAQNHIEPQGDFRGAQTENGGWEATQSFRIRKSDLDSFTVQAAFPIGTILRSLDPNCSDFVAFLRLSKITGLDSDGVWNIITAQFQGFAGATSENDPPLTAPVPTYSKRGTLKPQPLNQHPKWKALSVVERTALGKLISGEWAWGPNPFETDGSFFTYVPGETNAACVPEPITSADALEFAQRISEGQTTYDLGTYSYIHRWEDNVGVSATQMNDLGHIATPSGSPPKPSATRDWLMDGVNEEQLGSGSFRFTNELTYLLSDEGGHDAFLQS